MPDLSEMMRIAKLGCGEDCSCREGFVQMLEQDPALYHTMAHLIKVGARKRHKAIEQAAQADVDSDDTDFGSVLHGFGDIPTLLQHLESGAEAGQRAYLGPLPAHLIEVLDTLEPDTRESVEQTLRANIGEDNDPDDFMLVRLGDFVAVVSREFGADSPFSGLSSEMLASLFSKHSYPRFF